MAGVARVIVVLLSVFSVLKAEPFGEKSSYDDDIPANAYEAVNPEELAGYPETEKDDFIDDFDGAPIQTNWEGMENDSSKTI